MRGAERGLDAATLRPERSRSADVDTRYRAIGAKHDGGSRRSLSTPATGIGEEALSSSNGESNDESDGGASRNDHEERGRRGGKDCPDAPSTEDAGADADGSEADEDDAEEDVTDAVN